MRLNSFLRFIGNPAESSIEFSSIVNRYKNKKLEVDDFEKTWKFLRLLDGGIDSNKLSSEAGSIGIPQDDLDSWVEVLTDAHAIGSVSEGKSLGKKEAAFLEYLKANGTSYVRPSDWRAVVVGVGTIGSTLVGKLIEHGVQKFTLIDPDTVDEENLGTQRFYKREHIGEPKCEALANELLELFSGRSLEFTTEVSTLRRSKRIYEDLNKRVVVFLAADEIRSFDNAVMKVIVEKNVPLYRSAYGVYMAGAFAVRTPDEVDAEFPDSTFEFSQNIGMSIEGDIAASLMVRMWVNDSLLKRTSGRTHIDTMFPSGNYNYSLPIELKNAKKADEVQLAYMNFIQTGAAEDWEKVEALDHEREFLESHDELYYKHEQALAELSYDINGEIHNATDAIRRRMSVGLPIEVERALEKDLPKLIESAFNLISARTWDPELSQEEFSVCSFLSKEFVKQVYKNTLDFADYTPFSKEGICFDAAKELVLSAYAPVSIAE